MQLGLEFEFVLLGNYCKTTIGKNKFEGEGNKNKRRKNNFTELKAKELKKLIKIL